MHFQRYAVTLAEQLGVRGPKHASKLGSPLDSNLVEGMRDDQIQQLYELMMAATTEPKEGEENKTS